MKIVLAIEGVDGAGKSSLAALVKRLCEQNGQPFTLVGRREGTADHVVGRLNRVLHEEASLAPQAALLVRLAREYQRAQLAAAVPSGVVVLDRFVLSILALVRLNGIDLFPFRALLKEVAARAHLHATLFARCPFEIARLREQERDQGQTSNGGHGVAMQRRMAEFLEDDFQAGVLTGQQWAVDNAGSLEAAEVQVEDYLLPYLQTGKSTALTRATDLNPNR
jgi:thymidylate kinase